MRLKIGLHVLLVVLLQDSVWTSDIHGEVQKCNKPDSHGYLPCWDEAISETTQKSTLDELMSSAMKEPSKIFTSDTDAAEKEVGGNVESDFDEILSNVKSFMEEAGKDLDIFGDVSKMMMGMLPSNENGEELKESTPGYSYPPLTKRTVKKPGDVIDVDIGEGETVKMIARSVRPPVFEVPNFFTDEECDSVVETAKKKGTRPSVLFTSKAVREAGHDITIQRVSEHTELDGTELKEHLLDRLQSKIAKLVDLPIEMIQYSAPMTVIKYEKGGHFYAHLDSNDIDLEKPCCFQTMCSAEQRKETNDCCRKCRFASLIHYLNDVEVGGETAFPMADISYSGIAELEPNWQNLTKSCHKARLRIKPEKGKTIVFYNHFVDKKGYLGPLDFRAHHGGCEVVKDQKWIATNWISTPEYSRRNSQSKYITADVLP